MHPTAVILAIATLWISYKGFKNFTFLRAYVFEIDGILIRKQYVRIISSAFLHGSWMHLGFNMVSLLAFADVLIGNVGSFKFLSVYLVSALGGNLLSLYIHRNEGNYSALGASGAVSGIVFAFIALFPTAHISLLFIPVGIPGWIFGLLYVLFSIYGIRSSKGHIGHDAHLGGALMGMLLALSLYPSSLTTNFWYILAVVVPAIVFIILIIRAPKSILVTDVYQSEKNAYTIDDDYNARKKDQEAELNRLLDKIASKGIDGLTKEEQQRLRELSDS